MIFFFFSSRRRHTRCSRDWSSDVCSSDLSYLSQNDLRLHFGLGAATRIDRVEIFWPSGKTDSLTNLAADEFYSVLEGSGIVPAVRVRPASPAKARPTPAPSAPSEQPHTLSLFGTVLSCRSWLFFETTPPPETISFDETSLRLSPLQRMLRSEEHTSELQSRLHLVCRLLLEKKKLTH